MSLFPLVRALATQTLRVDIRPMIDRANAFLTFASQAETVALWGIGAMLLAGICLFMERRRMKRAAVDRIGWVPWTGLFLTFAVLGGGLLAVAVPGLLRA
jgi:hypothetical protein